MADTNTEILVREHALRDLNAALPELERQADLARAVVTEHREAIDRITLELADLRETGQAEQVAEIQATVDSLGE